MGKTCKKCTAFFLIIIGTLLLFLVITLAVGIPLNKHVYDRQFKQYSVNICNSTQCVPLNETHNPIDLIDKSNYTVLPICGYAVSNYITGMCISPILTMQNASVCVVLCNNQTNTRSCNVTDCRSIYNCISDNITYENNNNTVTLYYGDNYYITINQSHVIANHFTDNDYCIEYNKITDTFFNLYIQSVIKDPPYQVNATCVVTICDISSTINYNYQIQNLTTGQTECNQTSIICEYQKNIYNSECNAMKHYMLSGSPVVIVASFIGTITGVFVLAGLLFLYFRY